MVIVLEKMYITGSSTAIMDCQGKIPNYSAPGFSQVAKHEALKDQLIKKILPKGRLKVQNSKNSITMRLRSKFRCQKRDFWLGKGFSKLEAVFLSFHDVPKRTSIEDCSKLLQLCNIKTSRKERNKSLLHPTGNPKQPKIVVVFESQPPCKSFNKVINEIQLAIQEEINKLPGGTPVKITDSYTEGHLYLICENIYTKKWLTDIIPSLVVKNPDTEEDVNFFVREVPVYPSNCVKINAHIPCREDYTLTIGQILEKLSDQNPSLVTKDWKTLEFRTVRTGIKMIFLVNIKCLDVMSKLNWSLNYNNLKAKFQLARKDRSLNFWNKKDEKEPNAKLFESEETSSYLKYDLSYVEHCTSQTQMERADHNKHSNTSWRGTAKNRPYGREGRQGRGGQSNYNRDQVPYSQRSNYDRNFHQPGSSFNGLRTGYQDEGGSRIPYFGGSTIQTSRSGFQEYNPSGRFQVVDSGSTFWGNHDANCREGFHGTSYRNDFPQINFRNSRGNMQQGGFQNRGGQFECNVGNPGINFPGADCGNQRENYTGDNYWDGNSGW